MVSDQDVTKLQKADATRQRLLDVSLALFQKHGYEKATMRAIAKAAGLAPGAAYYHFATKDHIIFDFYRKSFEDHLPGVERILADEKELGKRIAGAIKAHMDVAKPFHEMSKTLFQTAIHPDHPLSPFSEESGPLRERNIAIFKKVVEGTSSRIPKNLVGKLPEILWLYKMAIIFYWVHDRSPGQKKTFELIGQGADLIAKLVSLANLPGIRGLSEKALQLFYRYKTYS